ncbi:MAG: alanine--glyoxylate aminotransferase family protein [Proteocatella sp.]
MLKIMTPGPTQVRENVRMKRSIEVTNPDLDLNFYDYYRDTCKKIGSILHTSNEVFIMSGEAILGLEAACASLTETGDRILVIDNGIFGRGFSDFVKIYGGNPILFEGEYDVPVDTEKLSEFLKMDSNFKYATVVHCDTPSGVLNNINEICKLLNDFGILSVVDSVSGMFGEDIFVDESRIDILCGGSQKALSAPVGLTLLCVSGLAFEAMEKRKLPIASFYANILNFKNYYENKWFPYTMPISDIYGFNEAVDNILKEKEFVVRHKRIAEATRIAISKSGLELYLKAGFSNTVTVIKVPEGLKDTDILNSMKDKYNVMIAGCFDCLAGKVFRIGHMGENANIDDMCMVFEAMQNTFLDLGQPLSCNLKAVFMEELQEVHLDII